MVLMNAIMQLTIGPIHWVILPEITSDQQFALAATFHYINGIELSLVTEYMVEYLGPAGNFLFYAIATFLGAFFYIFILKETSHLTDKQKKCLYYPKDLQEDDQNNFEELEEEPSTPDEIYSGVEQNTQESISEDIIFDTAP